MELSYHGRHQDASEVFQLLIKSSPWSPVGYLLRAAALESYMSDYSTFEPEEEFYALLDSAVQRAEELLAEEGDVAETHFFVGAAHFYRGFHYARKKEYLKTLAELAKAKGPLEETARLDSTFYDAYLGLGILEYLGTKAKDYLNPFASGEYDRSIEMIGLSGRGKYTSVLAREALVLALAGAARWSQAIEQAHALIDSFPTNRLFYWALIEIYRRKEDPEGVISIGYRLMELVEDGQPDHYYNQSLLRSYLADGHLQLRQYRECIKQCDAVLSLLRGRDLERRDSDVRADAVRIKRDAARALARKVDR